VLFQASDVLEGAWTKSTAFGTSTLSLMPKQWQLEYSERKALTFLLALRAPILGRLAFIARIASEFSFTPASRGRLPSAPDPRYLRLLQLIGPIDGQRR